MCAAHDAHNTRANNCAYSVTHGSPHGDRNARTYVHSDTHVDTTYNSHPSHGDTKCNLHGNPQHTTYGNQNNAHNHHRV